MPIGSRRLPRRVGGFPVSAVEETDLVIFGFDIEIVETARIYQVEVRSRSRMAKGMHSTALAEVMLRKPGVELIEGQVVTALQQAKLCRRHPDKERALLGAYRTIASA